MSFYTKEYRQKLNLDRAATLTAELKSMCLDGLNKLEIAGYEPLITEAFRPQAEQDAYFAQGRQSLNEVNELRGMAGLDPINDEENSKIVTKTLSSKHTERIAFDIVNTVNGYPDWNDDAFYEWAAKIYKEIGLSWGGDWHSFKDKPHFEKN